MLLIDEMLQSLKHKGQLGLCKVTDGGAAFIGRISTEDDGRRLARRMGADWPCNRDIEFVVHRHNGGSGWSAGTEVIARFDRHGKRLPA